MSCLITSLLSASCMCVGKRLRFTACVNSTLCSARRVAVGTSEITACIHSTAVCTQELVIHTTMDRHRHHLRYAQSIYQVSAGPGACGTRCLRDQVSAGPGLRGTRSLRESNSTSCRLGGMNHETRLSFSLPLHQNIPTKSVFISGIFSIFSCLLTPPRHSVMHTFAHIINQTPPLLG